MFDSSSTTHQLQTRIITIISFVLIAASLVVLSASCAPETTPTPPAHGGALLG
jgi:hypothetical protein